LRLIDIRVPCDERAPAAAREALAGLRVFTRKIGDLTLIASELITNAVLHSGCNAEDELELLLERLDGHLRLSVLDPGRTGKSADVAIDEQRASGGVGLFLVEQLASQWGAERSEHYRVWAEVPGA
jgi:anti-sigma regulatory factor (Ser/Thr protein kinase)